MDTTMAKLTPERFEQIMRDASDGEYIDLDSEFYPDSDTPRPLREVQIDGVFSIEQIIEDLELEALDIQPGDTVKNIAHPELDWRTVVRVIDDKSITIHLAGAESGPLPIDLFRVAVKREVQA